MHYSLYHPSQAEEIKQLFLNTFSDSEGESEGLLVSNLAFDLMKNTEASKVEVYVATEESRIVGCILLSTMNFDSKASAYLLSPVAIATQHQGKGIGQALIGYALKELKEKGVELVMTYGDPNFYSKVGFQPVETSIIASPYPLTQPQGWLANSLNGAAFDTVFGKPVCVEVFNHPELW
ncbi:GNAT family N-acetyltransferase [Vibrio coralliilyticus]